MQIDPNLWIGSPGGAEAGIPIPLLEAPPGEFDLALLEQLNMGQGQGATLNQPNAAEKSLDFFPEAEIDTESEDIDLDAPPVVDAWAVLMAQPQLPIQALATVMGLAPLSLGQFSLTPASSAPAPVLATPGISSPVSRAVSVPNLPVAELPVSNLPVNDAPVFVTPQPAEQDAPKLVPVVVAPMLEKQSSAGGQVPTQDVSVPSTAQFGAAEPMPVQPETSPMPRPSEPSANNFFPQSEAPDKVQIEGLIRTQPTPTAPQLEGWDEGMAAALNLVQMTGNVADEVRLTKPVQRLDLMRQAAMAAPDYPKPVAPVVVIPEGDQQSVSKAQPVVTPQSAPSVEPPEPDVASDLVQTRASAVTSAVTPEKADKFGVAPAPLAPEIERPLKEKKVEVAVKPVEGSLKVETPLMPTEFRPVESVGVRESAPVREVKVDIQPEQIREQVMRRIEQIEEFRPPMNLTIKMNPIDLGEITLTVRTVGGESHATLNSTHSQVHQALVQGKQELMQVAESKGLNLSSFDLTQQQGGQNPANQPNRQDFERNINVLRSTRNETEAIAPTEVIPTFGPTRALDVRI